MDDLVLFKNIALLQTNAPLTKKKSPANPSKEDLGLLTQAWMVIEEKKGLVVAVGSGSVPKDYSYIHKTMDLDQAFVMPGLIDAHTHPIFAGQRAGEFAMRLEGASYQEIAAKGGGIKASFLGSKQASDEQLLKNASSFFDTALSYGVTTVEAKSGYGETPADELRLLRLLQTLKKQHPVHIEPTCLALHGIPRHCASASQWVQEVIRQVLPQVKEEDLASSVDMFIEDGYFSVDDCLPFVERAHALGLACRVHADEFSDAKAAEAAARWGALSADHLQCSPLSALEKMASAGVVATILPGTSLYAKIPFTDGKRIKSAGCPIAIATDFNPGSCYMKNLPFLAVMAGIHCGLEPADILCGITFTPARALSLSHKKGALAPGYDGDFVVSAFSSYEMWLADVGQTPPRSVFIKGKKVLGVG